MQLLPLTPLLSILLIDRGARYQCWWGLGEVHGGGARGFDIEIERDDFIEYSDNK